MNKRWWYNPQMVEAGKTCTFMGEPINRYTKDELYQVIAEQQRYIAAERERFDHWVAEYGFGEEG